MAGGLLGGLAIYILGRGYQKIKGEDGVTRLQWSKEFLHDEWVAAGMRYMTIAHFGRGQGDFQEPLDTSLPPLWKGLIDKWTKEREKDITAALSEANTERVRTLLECMIREILDQLYPKSMPDHSNS